MTALEFLQKHGQSPVFSADELNLIQQSLSQSAKLGLEGGGCLPMIPAYLSEDISSPEDAVCAVMDAGGTNLRTALARFCGGVCSVENIRTIPMPASGGEVLSSDELYSRMAGELGRLGEFDRIGCCFSYLVDIERNLDGKLREWCKEIRAPECVGKYVGKELCSALGGGKKAVVLNDSTAAMLGAKASLPQEDFPFVGLILGTGLNICYSEKRELIKKLAEDISCGTMIISTEAGEFDGIALGDFEKEVILSTDNPNGARAEKQCSGAYLALIIEKALQGAAAEGIISHSPTEFTLADVSGFITDRGSDFSKNFANSDIDFAREVCKLAVMRSVWISALLTAEFVKRSAAASDKNHIRIAAEGSLFWKMHGFKDSFEAVLGKLLEPCGITFRIEKADNPCLEGAALAAFASGV